MASFSELGIPFPLFEAPTTEAANYVGVTTCAICFREDLHCFKPDTLIVRCPACGSENPRPSRPYRLTAAFDPCRSCRCVVIFPRRLKVEGGPAICYACFRAGLGVDGKETEYGAISYEAAERGFADSHPHLDDCPFELVPDTPTDDPHSMGWHQACIPRADMWELLRTPGFFGWQQSRWLFCCRRPMTYLGKWKSVVDSRHRPADERAFFDALVAAGDDPESAGDDHLWRAVLRGSCEIYVFRCRACDGYRGYWDCC